MKFWKALELIEKGYAVHPICETWPKNSYLNSENIENWLGSLSAPKYYNHEWIIYSDLHRCRVEDHRTIVICEEDCFKNLYLASTAINPVEYESIICRVGFCPFCGFKAGSINK